MHTTALDLREQSIKFAVPNHGIAANQGDMERPVLIDQRENARDQLVAPVVGEFPELGFASKMGSVEGIAPGTAQGALFGDLDGKGGGVAGQDASPCTNNFGFLHDLSTSGMQLEG
jgi:hypothetical protein